MSTENEVIEVHWPNSLRAVSPFYPLPDGVSSLRYIDKDTPTLETVNGSNTRHIDKKNPIVLDPSKIHRTEPSGPSHRPDPSGSMTAAGGEGKAYRVYTTVYNPITELTKRLLLYSYLNVERLAALIAYNCSESIWSALLSNGELMRFESLGWRLIMVI
jgi:hypothetical protein